MWPMFMKKEMKTPMKTTKKIKKPMPLADQKGFTLLEVLIALAIFAVGILAVLGLQITSIKGNDSGREITESTAIASDQLEQLMAKSYGDITDFIGGSNVKTVTVDDYTITLTLAPDTPEAGMSTITAEAAKTSGTGGLLATRAKLFTIRAQ